MSPKEEVQDQPTEEPQAQEAEDLAQIIQDHEEFKADAADAPDEETEEVLPDPSDVHPAASVEVRRATLDTSEYGKYFIGMWGPKPNFGCPYCPYASIEGEGDVELHILSKIDSGDLKHMAALELEGE